MPSVYLDISITVHYIVVIFSDHSVNRLRYMDISFRGFLFLFKLRDLKAAVALLVDQLSSS